MIASLVLLRFCGPKNSTLQHTQPPLVQHLSGPKTEFSFSAEILRQNSGSSAQQNIHRDDVLLNKIHVIRHSLYAHVEEASSLRIELKLRTPKCQGVCTGCMYVLYICILPIRPYSPVTSHDVSIVRPSRQKKDVQPFEMGCACAVI